MDNYVIAVFEVECYAGENTEKLVDVFVRGTRYEDIPEIYKTDKYIYKAMKLQQIQ